MINKAVYKLTHCDSGLKLNPLMYVFIFITLVWSVGMLIGDASIATTVLYSQTQSIGQGALNVWGAVGLVAVISHVLGLLIRGGFGLRLMQVSMFSGFYIWLWAGVIYLSGGFIFQFLAAAVPNLLFWIWYAWQWRKRHHKRTVAFV